MDCWWFPLLEVSPLSALKQLLHFGGVRANSLRGPEVKGTPRPSFFGSSRSSEKTDRTFSLLPGDGYRLQFWEHHAEESVGTKIHKLSDLGALLSSLQSQNHKSVEHEDELMEPHQDQIGRDLILIIHPDVVCAFKRISIRISSTLLPDEDGGRINSAMRELRDLNFPLLQELSTKKDASTQDVMDLLQDRKDKVIIGSQALSVALDICRGRVEKMERNLIERLPFLKGVFASIDDPLSAEAFD
ncbi:hypothetical protein Tco_0357494 [Tanacetum coccineum]